jgi:hypothetical protein
MIYKRPKLLRKLRGQIHIGVDSLELAKMLASFFVGIILAVAGAIAQNSTFTNPLKDPNGSDPFMVYEDGYYYLTTTTWEDIQLTRATTLDGLKEGETKLIFKDTDPDRSHNVWAPGE